MVYISGRDNWLAPPSPTAAPGWLAPPSASLQIEDPYCTNVPIHSSQFKSQFTVSYRLKPVPIAQITMPKVHHIFHTSNNAKIPSHIPHIKQCQNFTSNIAECVLSVLTTPQSLEGMPHFIHTPEELSRLKA